MNNLISALGTQNIIVIVILAVFLVAMIVMTIVPQKKRQKQQQEMMNSLAVGTKLMTIGRLIGKIVEVNNNENTILLNVGTDDNPTLITIEKNAVGVILDAKQKPEPINQEPQPIFDDQEAVEETTVENAETVIEEASFEATEEPIIGEVEEPKKKVARKKKEENLD